MPPPQGGDRRADGPPRTQRVRQPSVRSAVRSARATRPAPLRLPARTRGGWDVRPRRRDSCSGCVERKRDARSPLRRLRPAV